MVDSVVAAFSKLKHCKVSQYFLLPTQHYKSRKERE
jgi:hypothetical protein